VDRSVPNVAKVTDSTFYCTNSYSYCNHANALESVQRDSVRYCANAQNATKNLGAVFVDVE